MSKLGDDRSPNPLEHWSQGDYALDVGGFLFAEATDESDKVEEGDELKYSPIEQSGVLGLVVVSQTCDIVQSSGGRQFVSVCPLVKRDSTERNEIIKGRRPSLAVVELSPIDTYADISRIMSISKTLLIQWRRQQGFSDTNKHRKFAHALERKFGRFAFPDDFVESFSNFQKRVWSRHDKDSDVGKIYRSIRQIRFRAAPSWNATTVEISIYAILEDADGCETGREEISAELSKQTSEIVLGSRYHWGTPKFMLAHPSELSAEDLLSSQVADFDFLSS